MTSTQSIVLTGPKQMSFKESPIHEVKGEGLLLKVEMVSICGSDVHLYEGIGFKATFPKILGHEFVGHVVAMGEQAGEAHGLKLGDRVTVEPYIPCQKCRFCLTGNYQNCVQVMTYGVSITCDSPPYL